MPTSSTSKSSFTLCPSGPRLPQLLIIAASLFVLSANAQTPLFVSPDAPPHSFDPAILDRIGVSALRNTNPTVTGSGVKVAQAETGENDNPSTWEVNPSYVNRPSSSFSWHWINGSYIFDHFPNDSEFGGGRESDHSDIVGRIFYGRVNSSNPEGVAPGVALVNNYQNPEFYFYYIGPNYALIDDEKVVNQSFVIGTRQGDDFDRLWDSYVSTRSVIFCSAVGDFGQGGDHPSSPATAFDSIAVGAFEGSSVAGPTVDGRSKPDITAPAEYTSYSTPMVSGAATLLVQAAGSTANATDARTIKALLLNGAVKPLYQANPADRWTHTETAPLDTRYGAGILNVFNSYKQLQAGQHGPDNPYNGIFSGWDFNTVTVGGGNAKTYTFALPSGKSYNGMATLVWQRQHGKTAINNLNLTLLNGGDVIAASTSAVDNVEHLFLQNLPAGTYDLKVEQTDSAASGSETYAVAFNFAPIQLVSAVSRKTHDGAGTYDIDLPLTGQPLGIECRSGGANGQHQVVFTFAVNVTVNSATCYWSDSDGNHSGTATASTNQNIVTVDLSGVPNARSITVALFGLNDGTNMSDIGVPMGVLLGDVNGSARTDSGDVFATQGQNGLAITQANFRKDVNASGRIDSGDVFLVRQNNPSQITP